MWKCCQIQIQMIDLSNSIWIYSNSSPLFRHREWLKLSSKKFRLSFVIKAFIGRPNAFQSHFSIPIRHSSAKVNIEMINKHCFAAFHKGRFIPYICHFFYTDRIFENQILHQKKRLKSPKTLKMSLKKSYICIFFTHSGKIYTWQKFFTQTCLWCLWQIWGMPQFQYLNSFGPLSRMCHCFEIVVLSSFHSFYHYAGLSSWNNLLHEIFYSWVDGVMFWSWLEFILRKTSEVCVSLLHVWIILPANISI